MIKEKKLSISSQINWKRLFRFTDGLHLIPEFVTGDELDHFIPTEKGGRIQIHIPMRRLFSFSHIYFREVAISILHECGHYIVAHPSRRYCVDFGIPEQSRGIEAWDHEEIKACLVEGKLCDLLKIKRRFGKYPLKNNKYILRYLHGKRKKLQQWWDDEGEKKTINAFRHEYLNVD